MSGDSGHATTITPLTKRTKTGDLYKRRPEVDDQLLEFAGLSNEELLNRLRFPNHENPGHLYDETLVYLLREARRKEDLTMENLVFGHLAVRTEKLLRKHAYQIDPGSPEDFYQDIHFKLLQKVLNLDSDKGDYAQVMFGDFVATLAANEKRRIWRRSNAQPSIVDIDAPNEDGHDVDPEDERTSQEVFAIINNRLDQLPARTATAFLMHYLDGIQIESGDSKVPTVARHFQVSGRTIRNWFKDAVKMLKEEEEENDERGN